MIFSNKPHDDLRTPHEQSDDTVNYFIRQSLVQ